MREREVLVLLEFGVSVAEAFKDSEGVNGFFSVEAWVIKVFKVFAWIKLIGAISI